MGWETAVNSAFNAYSTNNQLKTSEANAGAQVQSGQYQIQNIADNTVRQAGAVQTSFLQGGIAMQGGPQAVLAQIFAKGNTDIARTATNADNQASNTVNSARTQALNSIAQNFMRSTGGTSGITSGLQSLSYGTGSLNGLGQTVGSALDPSPVGPYQSPF